MKKIVNNAIARLQAKAMQNTGDGASDTLITIVIAVAVAVVVIALLTQAFPGLVSSVVGKLQDLLG